MLNRLASSLLVASLTLMICGCGGGADDAPAVAPVKGKVLRKGEPLPFASITFEPVEAEDGKRSPSSAMTNEQGEYELTFNRDLMGATLGKHTVRIVKDGATDENGAPNPDAVVVPVKYNTKSELEADVPAAGLTDKNFDLDF
ncbi:MAG: hypothetical protein R3C01_03410 [Planctomycetaceae bacterium]